MIELIMILLILSGTVLLVLSLAAFQRRQSPLALVCAATMLCAVIWNYGFAAEILTPSLQGKLFWANVQFIGIVFLPPSWLAMSLIFTGQPRQTLRMIPALLVLPALTLLIIWTDAIHHLFRLNPWINTEGTPFPVLTNSYRLYFYAVHIPYGYFLFAVALFLLVRAWRQAPTVFRQQRMILVLSLVIPLLVDLLYVLGITPVPAFNFTSIVFTVSGLLISIGVLRLRFLDVLPLAYEAAVNEMKAGMIVLDSQGRVSHLNPAAEKLAGVSNDLAIGAAAGQVIPRLAALWEQTQEVSEIAITQGNEQYTYQVQRSPIRQGRGESVGQVITLEDVSERARLYQQVQKLSITDPLTQALNRRALNQRGAQEIERARRYQHDLSVILLDVDNFKMINDIYSHQKGDDVLVALAQIVSENIRINDLLFRYGGDEFVIILVETSAREAIETANRIRRELARITVGDERRPAEPVQVSLGVTHLFSGDNLESLLHRADQALYRAKAAGKGKIVCV